MVRACHKLSRINEVYMLNLGLIKIKQETTAPQIISFHRTLQRKTHRTATSQIEILFTASTHYKDISNPHVPVLHKIYTVYLRREKYSYRISKYFSKMMCLQTNHRNGVGENGEELKIFLMLCKKMSIFEYRINCADQSSFPGDEGKRTRLFKCVRPSYYVTFLLG